MKELDQIVKTTNYHVKSRRYVRKNYYELVPLDRETLNTMFQVFDDWAVLLSEVDFTQLDEEWEDKIEEPQP